MEEIPLIYPNQSGTRRRYVLNTDTKQLERPDNDLSFQRHERLSPTSASGADASAYLQPLDDALVGAASISSVILGGQELLITTSALIEEPHVISVALSWKKQEEDNLDSPTIIELETKGLRVVAIRAFAYSSNRDGISLVLVGCRGTIVSFSLDGNLQADTETPLKILHREDYIPAPLLEQVGPSDLQGNMISFLPSENHWIVIALAPLILTIDWKDTGTSSIWSETQCLEDMAARAAPFTGMITSLPSLILGKVDANVVDMAPTAALSVSTNQVKDNNFENEDTSAILVFTLHSDASIRKWLLDPESSMSPIEVSVLETTKLSHPSTWSDGIKSVALCARIYEQTFALAVYIKTNTFSSYNEGVSDCNIWVFDGQAKSKTAYNCQIMRVPRDALSLVGMSFSPSQRRCTLSVVFEAAKVRSGDSKDSLGSGIKVINYPPSLLSIVSSEPDVVDANNLDQIAITELKRIRSLPYASIVLAEVDDEVYDEEGSSAEEPFTVDRVLNKLDALYMKHLFRPIFPRGNGTVLPPSESCIRRALSKLVHGAVKEHGMSVELETIKTLYEWRNRDKRKSAIGSPSKLSRSPDKKQRAAKLSTETGDTKLSVYDSFVEPEEDVDGEDMMIPDDYDESEKFEEEIVTEVESHESRWQRLLHQVWEEEQILRSPQCVSWLESLPVKVLVRANITTALTSNGCMNTNISEPWKQTLENASKDILELIEADQDKSNAMYSIEDQLFFLLSNAQLVIDPQTSIIEEMTSLGRWARSQVPNSDNAKLRKLINQEVSVTDLIAWIEDRPTCLSMYEECSKQTRSDSDTQWSHRQVAKVQLRHASCSLAIRATDFIRRSRLSKCLLLLDLAAGSRVTFVAIRAYVQSLAILWTSAQRIKMPDTAFQSGISNKMRGRKIRFEDDSPRNSSPPTKRSSFGDNTSTILMPSTNPMSTALDVTMIKISQDMIGSFNATSTPFSAISLLTGSFVDLIFAPKGTAINGARRFMPELSVLPEPQDREQATDHPDLALRILSPFVAFQTPDDSPESISARKEELSSCLLHAAQSKFFSASRKSLMREMACDLLIPKNQDYVNPVQRDYTKEGLVALKSIKADRISVTIEDLRSRMQSIVPNATSVEIVRLCGLATARDLFTPYSSIPDANLDDITRSHAIQIAKLMLRLSQILHRLNILEKYVSRIEGSGYGDDYNSDSLLQIISDAITDMESSFPKEHLEKMPEYISIWTKKFDHAVRACRWSQAYNACVKNPLDAHRDSNFKRLVRAMVDSGALNELLDMCTQLGMGGAVSLAATDDEFGGVESIDLYEIASEVLLTYADCDVYDSRASPSSYNTNLSDYQGALYALHASQEQWRRAAQSLDLRYVNAEKALRRATGKSDINIQASELRDGLIIEDLVLSSCGSTNVIQLVKDPDYQFLVSGEYGKFSVIQLGIDTPTGTPNRLKRGRSNDDNSSSKNFTGAADRLSRFMRGGHLDCRAIRSVALKTLFLDKSTSYNFAKTAFRRSLDTSPIDVDELFKNGYYQCGLLLAKECSKVYCDGQSKPEGEDVFGRSLSLLMKEYLVPLASSHGDTQRPTLQQLQTSIDAASSSESAASYIVTERSVRLDSLEKTAIRAATCALLEKLTVIHSSADTPLALDVAMHFLENAHITNLPVWLERLLLGLEKNASGGAFAPRTNPDCKDYLGNPSALLKLYTRRGMFLEACNVVTLILGDNNLISQAASRLPEKGNIDCVPYHSIDLLWNLIEIACSKGAYDYDEKRRILKAREGMEQAIQKHYESIQESESGMRSSRMLIV